MAVEYWCSTCNIIHSYPMSKCSKAQAQYKQGYKQRTNNIYANTKWKALRKYYVSKRPYCERCYANGVITSGKDLHHIHLADSNSGKGKEFSIDNVVFLCGDCHIDIHNKLREGKLNNGELDFSRELLVRK